MQLFCNLLPLFTRYSAFCLTIEFGLAANEHNAVGGGWMSELGNRSQEVADICERLLRTIDSKKLKHSRNVWVELTLSEIS